MEAIYGFIIAGDGYAYVPYGYRVWDPDQTAVVTWHLAVLRVNSAGLTDNIEILNWRGPNADGPPLGVNMITNADTGVLLTWNYSVPGSTTYGMAITAGASASLVSGPGVELGTVIPVLQAQDGSFVGTLGYADMVAFDANGDVRWIVPNEKPQIATADGGVIGQSGITYDQNGNATGQIKLPIESWTGNAYQLASVEQVAFAPVAFAFSYAAAQGANPSGSGTHVRPYSAPQESLYALATANLTATPQCSALLAQFANVAQIPEATLIGQLQATANGARDYVYDGPSSSTFLDPIKFPGTASPGVTTVGQWFAANGAAPSYAEGLSQFNGYAVWFRLDDWHSWINFSQFLKFWSGKLNYYAAGTVMHEILHKQAVGGGFTHNMPPDARDMGAVIAVVGWPPGMVTNHNSLSEAFGLLCFPNLK